MLGVGEFRVVGCALFTLFGFGSLWLWGFLSTTVGFRGLGLRALELSRG